MMVEGLHKLVGKKIIKGMMEKDEGDFSINFDKNFKLNVSIFDFSGEFNNYSLHRFGSDVIEI